VAYYNELLNTKSNLSLAETKTAKQIYSGLGDDGLELLGFPLLYWIIAGGILVVLCCCLYCLIAWCLHWCPFKASAAHKELAEHAGKEGKSGHHQVTSSSNVRRAGEKKVPSYVPANDRFEVNKPFDDEEENGATIVISKNNNQPESPIPKQKPKQKQRPQQEAKQKQIQYQNPKQHPNRDPTVTNMRIHNMDNHGKRQGSPRSPSSEHDDDEAVVDQMDEEMQLKQRQLFLQRQFMEMMINDAKQQQFLLTMNVEQRKTYIQQQMDIFVSQQVQQMQDGQQIPGQADETDTTGEGLLGNEGGAVDTEQNFGMTTDSMIRMIDANHNNSNNNGSNRNMNQNANVMNHGSNRSMNQVNQMGMVNNGSNRAMNQNMNMMNNGSNRNMNPNMNAMNQLNQSSHPMMNQMNPSGHPMMNSSGHPMMNPMGNMNMNMNMMNNSSHPMMNGSNHPMSNNGSNMNMNMNMGMMNNGSNPNLNMNMNMGMMNNSSHPMNSNMAFGAMNNSGHPMSTHSNASQQPQQYQSPSMIRLAKANEQHSPRAAQQQHLGHAQNMSSQYEPLALPPTPKLAAHVEMLDFAPMSFASDADDNALGADQTAFAD